MNRITITVNMSSSAFEEKPEAELSRVLRLIAYDILWGNTPPQTVRDIEGNICGTCVIETQQ